MDDDRPLLALGFLVAFIVAAALLAMTGVWFTLDGPDALRRLFVGVVLFIGAGLIAVCKILGPQH